MTITLTKEASSGLTGIPAKLFNDHYAHVLKERDAAWEEMNRWHELAEKDERNWRAYERREELAMERWKVWEKIGLNIEAVAEGRAA